MDWLPSRRQKDILVTPLGDISDPKCPISKYFPGGHYLPLAAVRAYTFHPVVVLFYLFYYYNDINLSVLFFFRFGFGLK